MRKDDFDELAYWKRQLRDGTHGKETKNYLLREIRAAAFRRNVFVPAYNSPEFSEFIRN